MTFNPKYLCIFL